MPSAAYEALNEATNGGDPNMLHLPFALSSISFFHSIPGVPNDDKGLKLNACLLAKIFNGKITRWDDSEILNVNDHIEPELKKVANQSPEGIYVARRVHGSSSTSSITKYMNQACGEEWPTSKVGSELGAKGLDEWHVRTKPCEGSGGMTECLRENPGAIGYLDSGHGWSEDLPEVNVQNLDQKFLTSRAARAVDGIAGAAASTPPPDRIDGDWGNIQFINKAGEDTWPIVVMSYVYLRKDIDVFVSDPVERGLLKLFLESLYDDDYFGKCTDLGFSKPPPSYVKKATNGLNIQGISWNFPESYGQENMWSFESKGKTRKIAGAGEYVISGKRQSLNGLKIDEISGKETELEKEVKRLSAIVASMTSGDHGHDDDDHNHAHTSNKSGGEDSGKSQSALVLSAISFTLWLCAILGYLVQRFLCGGKALYE